MSRPGKALEGGHSSKVVALTVNGMRRTCENPPAARFDGYVARPIDLRMFPAVVASCRATGRAGPAASAPPEGQGPVR